MQSDEQIAKMMHSQSDDDGCSVPWEKQSPRYRAQQRRQVRKALSALTATGCRILGPDELDRKFKLGDRVTKTKGSAWTGHVVGFYSTNLTPVGYAVESENEPGSVQIYPEAAIRSLSPEAPQPEAKEARE